MKHLLNLKYKGDRKYLHGTDIYSAIVDYYSNTQPEPVFLQKLAFRSLAFKQCFIVDQQPEKKSSIIADIKIKLLKSNSVLHHWLIHSNMDVTSSYPYDDSIVAKNAKLELSVEGIRDTYNPDFTAIEQIVALTKKLSYVINPGITGNWLFGQLDLTTALPIKFTGVLIKRTKIINNHFSTNNIYVDDTLIGTIRFIVGEIDDRDT